MAISKIKIGSTEHELQTTIANVEGLQTALDNAATNTSVAYDKIISRGEQLIVNGNGLMGNNTNFSGWVFDGKETNNSIGSFTYNTPGVNKILETDEFFPVNPQSTYALSIDAKSKNGLGTMYSFLSFFDVDKKPIKANNHMFVPGSTTTLAQDLKAGDTVVYLTSAAGFSAAKKYANFLAVWNYKNSFGYVYPKETYTRNRYKLTASDDYTTNIDTTNNTVTLAAAYEGETIPAGTFVSQGMDGATYKYCAMGNTTVPTTWATYRGTISGVDLSGTNVGNTFPPGTAYAKLGFLWNHNKANDYLWITNLSVTDIGHNTTYTLTKSGNNITLTGSDGSTTSVVDTDTAYTAGSSNTSSKIFLIGTTEQTENGRTTFSHDTAYVGNDGYLYSNSEKVNPRIYASLIPTGSAIPANADLNTVEYLKVGSYYCSANNTVKTLKNCPLTTYDNAGTGTSGVAFMMQVYSPLSPWIDNETTSTWVTRVRKITHYYTGIEYMQYCYVGSVAGADNWIYGDWYITPRSKFTFNTTSESTPAIGSDTRPVYIDSLGTLTACTHTIGKSVPSDAKFTDTDTHYITGLTAGASGTTTNAAVTNPYIKVKDDSAHRAQIQLKGDGATTVSSDANGVITISSTDTEYTHPASGITAGTYKSVTVDANGHVTAGTNPTTLAGYGISDAASKTELEKAFAGKVDKEDGKGLFSGSYNDLSDKPFYDETELLLYWDGNTDGLETVTDDYGTTYYKISETPITLTQILDASFTRVDLETDEVFVWNYPSNEQDFVDAYNIAEDHSWFDDDFIMSVLREQEIWGVTFSSGVWTYNTNPSCYTIEKTNIKQLDEKFIPPTNWNAIVDAPKLISQFDNDASYATETFVTNKIAEAQLDGGDVDLSGYATKDDLNTYLPLAGGTLSGSVVPSTASSYALGTGAMPWAQVNSKQFNAMDNNVSYGHVQVATVGTTSTVGVGKIVAGNGTVKGIEGNAKGQIVLYGESSGHTTITPDNNTKSDITLTLPSTSGTLALANPSYIEFTSTVGHGGYIDFHYNGSSNDYTSRIIEATSGTLSVNGAEIETNGATFTATDTTEQYFRVVNSLHNGHLCTSTTGRFGLWSNTNNKWLILCEADGKIKFTDTIYVGNSTDYYIDSSGNVKFVNIKSATHKPITNSYYTLGDSDYKWKQLYASTATISTSDRNQKKDIIGIEEDTRYIDLFDKLTPVSYKFIDGDSGRTHVGFISQDIEEAMTEVGLSDLEFAGFCRDQKTAYNEETGENELVYDENGNPEYNYALRYSEFIALNTKMIQMTREENKALKEKITTLEEKLSELEKKLS